ncbi:alpha-mannosidase [Microbacterium enclense]|nr:alpha-mannosidase [Microbacterium enclense]
MPSELHRIIARTRRHLDEWLRPATVVAAAPIGTTAWEAPGEPVPWEVAAAATYGPFTDGESWGRPWSTWWFRLEGRVPADWDADRVRAVVDLGFTHLRPGFQCEGTVWSEDGRILRAVEPMNRALPVGVPAGSRFVRLIEASANPDVLFAPGDLTGTRLNNGPTLLGDRDTAPADPLYRYGGARLELIDPETQELVRDVETLLGLLRVGDAESARSATIGRALARLLTASDPDDVRGTAVAARAAVAPVLAARTGGGGHRVIAVGHAHIDSAWLWPARETRRKAARTFANALALMEEDADFVFAASSAQQYAWIEEDYPDLFARIRERVAEGRFLPVGGMWVEPDTNLPSGESLVRQFLEGTTYFAEKFGVETDEVWLPDSFGYSAALPQIARAAGKRTMLAQKLSWNDTNRFPFTTFSWEGPDGSRLLTHMPSVDVYNAELSAEDLVRSAEQYTQKDVGTLSLVPFGYGDGGGGPTSEMLAAARRVRDLEGLPRVELGSPARFFAEAAAELPDPPTWTGELYLEFHRGVYTAQHDMKAGNRRSEHLLQVAEALAAAATVLGDADYPSADFRRLWRTVLLGQFHDVLPGTSIAWVHREMREAHRAIRAELGAIIDASAARLGITAPEVVASGPRPGLDAEDGDIVIDNGLIRARIDERGLVVSLIDADTGRDLVAPGAAVGLLQLHRDIASIYEAWELERDYVDTVVDVEAVERITTHVDAESAWVEVHRRHGASSFVQRFVVTTGCRALEVQTDVDWRERRTLLKLSFPLDVVADRAAYEIAHGFVERPIVQNTSWDRARFEVPAHRWVRVAESGFGAAVANDAISGHDVTRLPRIGGGAAVRVRQSLLRSPRFPDPETDQGRHAFRSSVLPAPRLVDAVEESARLGRLPDDRGIEALALLVDCESPSVRVDAVKLAEDDSGDVVVRLYEAAGTRAAARLRPRFAVAAVRETDVLERPLDGVDLWSERADTDALDLIVRPFGLRTLRWERPQ